MPVPLKIRLQKVRRSRTISSSPLKLTGPRNESTKHPEGSLRKESWRDKMKERNPAKYEKILSHSRLYSALYRTEAYTAEQASKKRNKTDEESKKVEQLLGRKKKLNESAKIRMRKMRERRKLKEGTEKPKPQTRHQREKHEKQKEKWRERKRLERVTRTEEEHQKCLMNRRAKYALKRDRERLHLEEQLRLKAKQEKVEKEKKRLEEIEIELMKREEEVEKKKKELTERGSDARSTEARRKSLERAKKSMPNKPQHYATTVLDLINKAPPETVEKIKDMKCKELKEDRLKEAVVRAVATEMLQPSTSSSSKVISSVLSAELKKEQLQRHAARKFNVNRKRLAKRKRLQAGRKHLSKRTTELVTDFFERNSMPLPDKRLVSKRTGKPTSQLDRSLFRLYGQFVKEHSDVIVSFAKFCQLRPRNTRTMGKAKLIGCVCEYCANVKLKLDIINCRLAKTQSPTIQDVYALNDITLCDKETGKTYHSPSCVQRECLHCGVDKIDEVLEPLRATHSENVVWKRWEIISQEVKVGKTTKTVKKRSLVNKTGSLKLLIAELKEELKTYSEHLFVKNFQNEQLQELRKNVPQDSALSILDFAENYVCRYQEEAQGAYWTHESATIHPFVTYYKCSCSNTITESVVVISDDLVHDHHAVHSFQKVVLDHLVSNRQLHLKRLYRFSDCCANQYRSKGPFADISYANTDFDIHIEHSYCGERHGKGASDGESAVIKSGASTAVKVGRAIIRNAAELYEYAKENLTIDAPANQCAHFKRTILYVPSDDVDRNRQRPCKTVPGTRRVHSIKTVRDGTIAIRNLTCCCSSCIDGKGICKNREYVHDWKEVLLHPAKDGEPQPSTDETHIPQSHPTAVKVGDFVAVIFDESWWPGEVTDVLQDSCLINFMSRKGMNRFIWPSQKDKASINKSGIFRLMPGPPAPVSNRYLGFDAKFVASITRDVKEYLSGN